METNGELKAATLAVAAMEARATEVAAVATKHKVAMEDQAVVAMEAVEGTVMTTVAPAEAAMAEATTLAAVQVAVPIGEVETKTLAPAEEVVATAVAMVAAAATTTTKRALLMEVVLNHHLTSLGLNLPSRHQVAAATRSSSATLTSLLTRTL